MKKVLLSVVMAAVLATSGTIAMAAPGGITDSSALKDLAAARRATAKYHDVSVALADGYAPGGPCVSAPPGGMGVHYGNPGLMGDFAVDPRTPEVLLYVPKGDKMKLVGVEYVVNVGPPWFPGEPMPDEPVSPPDAPFIFGQEMGDDGELMEPHGFYQSWHYDLHVWLWQGNPDGIFAEFNPNVICP